MGFDGFRGEERVGPNVFGGLGLDFRYGVVWSLGMWFRGGGREDCGRVVGVDSLCGLWLELCMMCKAGL